MFLVLRKIHDYVYSLEYDNRLNDKNYYDDVRKKRETLSKFLQKLVFKNFFCENFDYVFNFEYDDRG